MANFLEIINDRPHLKTISYRYMHVETGTSAFYLDHAPREYHAKDGTEVSLLSDLQANVEWAESTMVMERAYKLVVGAFHVLRNDYHIYYHMPRSVICASARLFTIHFHIERLRGGHFGVR